MNTLILDSKSLFARLCQFLVLAYFDNYEIMCILLDIDFFSTKAAPMDFVNFPIFRMLNVKINVRVFSTLRFSRDKSQR